MAGERYHKKLAFRLEIDGVAVAHFRTVSGLERNTAIIEEPEGAGQTSTKEGGRTTYEDVTCERGMTDNNELYLLNQKFVDGEDDAEFDATMVQTKRNGDTIATYNMYGCTLPGWAADGWDETADENQIERVVISIEGFDRNIT